MENNFNGDLQMLIVNALSAGVKAQVILDALAQANTQLQGAMIYGPTFCGPVGIADRKTAR